MVCAITNVGPHPITVTIEVIDLMALCWTMVVFYPSWRGSFLSELGPVSLVYCKFTGNFNRGFVRANAQIQDNGTTISVVPAQAVGE